MLNFEMGQRLWVDGEDWGNVVHSIIGRRHTMVSTTLYPEPSPVDESMDIMVEPAGGIDLLRAQFAGGVIDADAYFDAVCAMHGIEHRRQRHHIDVTATGVTATYHINTVQLLVLVTAMLTDPEMTFLDYRTSGGTGTRYEMEDAVRFMLHVGPHASSDFSTKEQP